MALEADDLRGARQRRLKEPIHILGLEVTASRVVGISDRAPRTTQKATTFVIKTVGDIAKLDAQLRVGKFIPMPDLSLQLLNVLIDKMGWLEEKEEHDGER